MITESELCQETVRHIIERCRSIIDSRKTDRQRANDMWAYLTSLQKEYNKYPDGCPRCGKHNFAILGMETGNVTSCCRVHIGTN